MGGRPAMLNHPSIPRRVLPLDRLESSPVSSRLEHVDWETPINRSRLFFCDTLTPLYYTTSYAALGPEHRRRYNQLMGMFSNEMTLRLETSFVDTALNAISRHGVIDAELAAAVRRFRDDERRHADGWRRLNQLSEPDWYRTDGPRLVRVSPVLDRLSKVLARHPAFCPLIFWIQLAQEEHSIEISRRCLRMPVDVLEPRYAAVYGEHMRDEVRHVQIDCHLIEQFYASQSLAARRITAGVFRWILSNLFLRPARSAVRIVEVLASEHQELQPLLPQMIRELRALVANDGYQQMMYSRLTTPLTFELFDAFPEFHSMSTVLRAYTPPPSARRP
jgi:P-aminobenzoate N-oxygenase AurF